MDGTPSHPNCSRKGFHLKIQIVQRARVLRIKISRFLRKLNNFGRPFLMVRGTPYHIPGQCPGILAGVPLTIFAPKVSAQKWGAPGGPGPGGTLTPFQLPTLSHAASDTPSGQLPRKFTSKKPQSAQHRRFAHGTTKLSSTKSTTLRLRTLSNAQRSY